MEEHRGGGEIQTCFRRIRLPRQLDVPYLRDTAALEECWRNADMFIVAEIDDEVKGFLDLTVRGWNGLAAVNNIVVDSAVRRLGIGRALLSEAARWAAGHRLRGLIVGTHTKNVPGMEFFQRDGFSFCGYACNYFPNSDITVFFTRHV
jgi:GNAT superfamily N-acetyltransferase